MGDHLGTLGGGSDGNGGGDGANGRSPRERTYRTFVPDQYQGTPPETGRDGCYGDTSSTSPSSGALASNSSLSV
ncbi:hypothetical protein C445_00295 [Halobiforma lacisalsi AJ5]|uniref:Uncharacterized protein n=1 Tax=Natronobacterium lacisalsi AJ5 TaxID=358396 RepID=M0M0Y6_NATLA|nr:hypothetical protein C445_00295 [Halobiforma lacisalsi AJ5]